MSSVENDRYYRISNDTIPDTLKSVRNCDSTPPKDSKWIDLKVMTLLMVCMLANCAYSMPAPFMPIEFEKKNINKVWIGWIFIGYPIGIIVFSPMVATIIRKHGRRMPI